MLLPDTVRFSKALPGKVNTSHGDIARNIRSSIKRGLPQVCAWPANDYKVALLCGGPSLAEAKVPRGWKVATVNGAYGWAIEHGLRPSLQVVLDARPHNARFVDPAVDRCRYLISSQCHPDVFDALDGRDVHIWHGAGKVERRILDRYYLRRWCAVPGGSTVGTRAIWLLYLLGVRRIDVWGMDSCIRAGRHHAYDQLENDIGKVMRVRAGRRVFRCHPWMVHQADEFLAMAASMPDDLRLGFRGDGLVQHLVAETARLGRPVSARVIGD